MTEPTTSQLAAVVDGKPSEPADAKALWERFSAYMDEHQGDFDGFAKEEGLLAARVDVVQGVPTLTLSSTAERAPEPGQTPKKRNRQRGRKRRR
jgi:hypothetical protein